MANTNGLKLAAGDRLSSASSARLGLDDEDQRAHGDERDPRTGSDAAPLITSQDTFDNSETSTLWLAIGLVITVVVVTFIAIVLKIYQGKGNISHAQKYAFNTIITGLILVLGLNFFEAFKSLAKSSRGTILSGRNYYMWTSEQESLIRGIESLMNVIKLGASRVKSWTIFLCYVWISLNILAQLAVALVSLTYSVDPGTESRDTYTSQGTVNVSRLDCYVDQFNNNKNCAKDEDGSSQTLAHAYGDLARARPCCDFNTTQDVLDSRRGINHCQYYCRTARKDKNNQQFAYRFHEYNPDDRLKRYPHMTNRIITAQSGQCLNYSIHLPPKTLPGGYLLYEYYNDTSNGNMTIPVVSGAENATTYVYQGYYKPQDAGRQKCGPRCMHVWAHRSRGHDENPQIYKCPITVDNVAKFDDNDAQKPSQVLAGIESLSDEMARLAATSIALSGRQNDDGSWNQYQLYTFNSAFETHFHRPDEVGAFMAQFALGSIATMADNNPTFQAYGSVPHLGNHLSVHWNFVIALLVGITIVHLLLLIGSMWFYRMDAGRGSEVELRGLRTSA